MMPRSPISPLRKAWLSWKSLKLPWRKRFLVGSDLNHNTFWEFHDNLSAGRMRRIVEPSLGPRSLPHSEITAQISPAWHQWLRHTRPDPPTIAEQISDVQRQAELKVLAKIADQRWEGRGRLSGPIQQDPVQRLRARLPAQQRVEIPGARTTVNSQSRSGVSSEETGMPTTTTVVGEEAIGSTAYPDATQPVTEVEAGRRNAEPASREVKDDPWKKARSGPGEEWQPEAWSPQSATARR